MAYPWYSTGKRFVGSNQLFAIIVEENCDTEEIRYRADIIDRKQKTGKKVFSSVDIENLKKKVEQHISKMEIKLEGQTNDVLEVFERIAD